MSIHFSCRSARPEGARARGEHAEPARHLPQRPRFRLRLRIFASQLSVQTSGEAARAQDSVHPGPPTHLLPETGRFSSSSSHRGQDIHGHSPVLRRELERLRVPAGGDLGLPAVLSESCRRKRRVILRDCALKYEMCRHTCVKAASYSADRTKQAKSWTKR